MRARIVFLLAATALGAIALAASVERGAATTRASLVRPVQATITDAGIELSRSSLERGTIAQFRVSNESSKPRNLVVGVERTALLDPGERARLIVDLGTRGPLPYRVTVNCAPGLEGVFTVR